MTPGEDNQTMTGSEITYTVGADVREITFQARDSTIEMAFAASGDYVTLAPLAPVTFVGRDLPGKQFFFTGTNTKILEVMTIKDSD